MTRENFYCIVLRVDTEDFLVTQPEYAICQFTFGNFVVHIGLDPKHAVWFDDWRKAFKCRDLLNRGFRPVGYFEPNVYVTDKETVLKEFCHEAE